MSARTSRVRVGARLRASPGTPLPGSGPRAPQRAAHCTHSLSLTPPPLPPPWAAVGRVCRAAQAGERKAQARERPGPWLDCARAAPTCGPRSPGYLSVGSGPAMGSGSVRARYLVYFQYLGTDFKYVPRLPPVPATPTRSPAPREAPE